MIAFDGVILSWNDGATKLFQYSAGEMVGANVLQLTPPQGVDEAREVLRCIRRGEVIREYETVRRRKDGSLVDVSLTLAPIRNEAGDFISFSAIIRDIGTRKSAEKLLRIQSQQQSAIAALGLFALQNQELQALFDRAVQVLAETLQLELTELLDRRP